MVCSLHDADNKLNKHYIYLSGLLSLSILMLWFIFWPGNRMCAWQYGKFGNKHTHSHTHMKLAKRTYLTYLRVH